MKEIITGILSKLINHFRSNPSSRSSKRRWDTPVAGRLQRMKPTLKSAKTDSIAGMASCGLSLQICLLWPSCGFIFEVPIRVSWWQNYWSRYANWHGLVYWHFRGVVVRKILRTAQQEPGMGTNGRSTIQRTHSRCAVRLTHLAWCLKLRVLAGVVQKPLWMH